METPIPASNAMIDILRGTWYFRMDPSGEVIEVDAMVVPSEEWPGRKEASDPSWRAMDFGRLLLAVKVLC